MEQDRGDDSLMMKSSAMSYDRKKSAKGSMSMIKSAKRSERSEPSKMMTGLANIGSSISSGISSFFKSKPKA